MIRKNLLPYLAKSVASKDLLSVKSIKPDFPKSIFFSIFPIGFIIAEIPLLMT